MCKMHFYYSCIQYSITFYKNVILYCNTIRIKDKILRLLFHSLEIIFSIDLYKEKFH